VNLFVEKITILDGFATPHYRIPVPSEDRSKLVQEERLSLRDPKCVLEAPIGAFSCLLRTSLPSSVDWGLGIDVWVQKLADVAE
jgi:hypothetical protein